MSRSTSLRIPGARPQAEGSAMRADLLLQREDANGSSAPSHCALGIGARDDPLEQEADRVADQVLTAPAGASITGARRVARPETAAAGGGTETVPPVVENVLAGEQLFSNVLVTPVVTEHERRC